DRKSGAGDKCTGIIIKSEPVKWKVSLNSPVVSVGRLRCLHELSEPSVLNWWLFLLLSASG
ncbi:TPA: hypothetical protein ACGKOC_004807, partial [Escherichia coli]|nr:hypothetical protein [Escherichia coli]